ncbi:MAG TPA: beta-N-acetylhexosaminidase [Candidatus Limnocylindria bacterium]|nr:beta-N-acetylhexosaminidase [Candidatus Limnocylindria bacterium]
MKRRAFLAGAAALACSSAVPDPTPSPTSRAQSLLSGMSIPDRAAQTMSVAFHGRTITSHLERMIREKHVAGVVIFRENVEDAAALRRLTADLQRIAREARVPPLLIAMDQEGGPVVRVTKGVALPPAQMALAAAPDPAAAVRRSAQLVARELRALGVNWQLAPVADVNDEPLNPIIGNRAFGSDPRTVGALVAIAVRAYADAGLLCCAKHFPGHGSATIDSHKELPEILSPRSRLDAVELVPFRAAIAADVPAIMSAHLTIPALGAAQQPATLSRAVMTDVLRTELGFRGLCVTDDLEMQALARSGGQAAAAASALQAGADYLLFRFDEGAQLEGHRLLVDAVLSGRVPPRRLDEAVTRVLEAKSRWNVLEAPAPPTFDLEADRAEALDLARQGVTVLRAAGLPLRGQVLAISYGRPDIAVVEDQPTLADVVARTVPGARAHRLERLTPADIPTAVGAARDADVVVVGTYDALADPVQAELVTALQRVRPTVAVALRSPYDVLAYPGVGGFVCAYSGREPSLVAAVEVMTGARPPLGRLPVDVRDLYRIGAGMRTL